jgi:hypothetical protein
MKALINRIQNNLTENLLSPKFKKMLRVMTGTEENRKYFGHCYVSCEAFYHIAGKGLGYKPHYIRMGVFNHWFLRRIKDGTILDITEKQFSYTPDYSKGIRCGFLTKKPSKRAQKLMRAVGY